MSSMKCRSEQQDTSIDLIDYPKSRTLTPPNARETVKQQKLSLVAGENAKVIQPFWKTA